MSLKTLQKFSTFVCLFLWSSLIPLQPAFAQSARITDIRFWQSPEEAQIVIDLSEGPKISPVSSLADGTSFFDIDSCGFRPGKQTYSLKNNFLDSLTVQERANGGVRIYFRVPQEVTQKTFFLPKNEVKSDRIVIFLSEPANLQEQRRASEQTEYSRLKANNVKIVVLDPGHGGEDPGARHNGIIEKDYVLGMGMLVKAFFDRDPKYRAVLTRTGDYIIPLERRSQIAEHVAADAFVSIHANYNSKRAIRGIEVYYESYHGAVGEAERIVAEGENQQDIIGGVDTRFYNSNKAAIANKQASVMFKSSQLAEKVERRMGSAVPGLYSRGVKRAGFRVLHSLALPSILVELGYISNPTEVAYLKHGPSQQRQAQAIYQGIKDFLEGTIVEGKDAQYLSYVREMEAAKKARAEKIRIARERRERAMKNSKPYQVKSGDTVSKVAAKFKVSVSTLCDLNQIGKKSKLKSGMTLRIPAG